MNTIKLGPDISNRIITDPDDLHPSEIILNFENQTIELSPNCGVERYNVCLCYGITLHALFCYLAEEWKINPHWNLHIFPITPYSKESGRFGGRSGYSNEFSNWRLKDDYSRSLIRNSSWIEIDQNNNSIAIYSNIKSSNPLSAANSTIHTMYKIQTDTHKIYDNFKSPEKIGIIDEPMMTWHKDFGSVHTISIGQNMDKYISLAFSKNPLKSFYTLRFGLADLYNTNPCPCKCTV